MSDPLFVFAKITPKPEFYDKAKEAILDIVPITKNEEGCYQFELYDGCGDGNLYLFEKWQNQSTLDAHYLKAYTKAVFDSYALWLAHPVEITKLSHIS